MSVRIILIPPTLPNADESVIQTLVEIATDAGFANIVGSASTTIISELYNVVIATELVDGNTYYARASFVTDLAGAEGWGPVVSFVATNSIEQNVLVRPPSRTIPPTISIPLFGVSEVPLTNFSFSIQIDPSIAASVRSVDFIIENESRNTVVAMNDIDRNFSSIFLDRWLSPDTLYIAKASVTLDDESVSMMGGLPFKTSPTLGKFKVISHTVLSTVSEILMDIPLGVDHEELELYDDVSLIYSDYTVVSNPATYDSTLENSMKVGRVRPIYANGSIGHWVYFYSEPKPYALPLDLPALLGNP